MLSYGSYDAHLGAVFSGFNGEDSITFSHNMVDRAATFRPFYDENTLESLFGSIKPNHSKNNNGSVNGRKYMRSPRNKRCYILLLDDPTLLNILQYLSPKDIFTVIPSVCTKFWQLGVDKYIIMSIKSRLDLHTNYVGGVKYNTINDLRKKLIKVYFNTFRIYYYHLRNNRYYIHGAADVTIYAEDTLNDLKKKHWYPKKKDRGFKFSRFEVICDKYIPDEFYNHRIIDFISAIKHMNKYSVPGIKWQQNASIYLFDDNKKFHNCPYVGI
jgi:hypothetical protein